MLKAVKSFALLDIGPTLVDVNPGTGITNVVLNSADGNAAPFPYTKALTE